MHPHSSTRPSPLSYSLHALCPTRLRSLQPLPGRMNRDGARRVWDRFKRTRISATKLALVSRTRIPPRTASRTFSFLDSRGAFKGGPSCGFVLSTENLGHRRDPKCHDLNRTLCHGNMPYTRIPPPKINGGTAPFASQILS